MDNPLRAVPEMMPDVECRTDKQGLIHLRKPRLYTGGLSRWLGTKLRWRADVKLELDEYGSFCWRHINGHNSLDQIAAQFSERFDRPRDDSRRAVLQFARDLMVRRLIHLKQPEPVS